MKISASTITVAAFAVVSTLALAQGPLSPPTASDEAVGAPPLDGNGDPVPTMKTLHQVEPRKPVNSISASAGRTRR